MALPGFDPTGFPPFDPNPHTLAVAAAVAVGAEGPDGEEPEPELGVRIFAYLMASIVSLYDWRWLKELAEVIIFVLGLIILRTTMKAWNDVYESHIAKYGPSVVLMAAETYRRACIVLPTVLWMLLLFIYLVLPVPLDLDIPAQRFMGHTVLFA